RAAVTGGGSGYVAPRDRKEELLAALWADVLGLDRVGVHDNFFALGGDSILGIRAATRARQAGLRFTPRQLFQHPTVAALPAVAGEGARARARHRGPADVSAGQPHALRAAGGGGALGHAAPPHRGGLRPGKAGGPPRRPPGAPLERRAPPPTPAGPAPRVAAA